jgi:hypothetical protein
MLSSERGNGLGDIVNAEELHMDILTLGATSNLSGKTEGEKEEGNGKPITKLVMDQILSQIAKYYAGNVTARLYKTLIGECIQFSFGFLGF